MEELKYHRDLLRKSIRVGVIISEDEQYNALLKKIFSDTPDVIKVGLGEQGNQRASEDHGYRF